MKQLIIFILIFSFYYSFAQSFSYNDTIFNVGAKKTIANLDYSTYRLPNKFNKKVIDSLTSFLRSNMNIQIQITHHTGIRGSEAFNLKLSRGRAETIRGKLIENGIDENRMIAIGLGESQPLIGESKILKMTTEEERENAHEKNERTIIEIIKK